MWIVGSPRERKPVAMCALVRLAFVVYIDSNGGVCQVDILPLELGNRLTLEARVDAYKQDQFDINHGQWRVLQKVLDLFLNQDVRFFALCPADILFSQM